MPDTVFGLKRVKLLYLAFLVYDFNYPYSITE